MKVVPRPLSADPEKWAQFKGVRKIGINDLPVIFPGFDPIEEIRLTVSSAPYPGHMSFAELGIVVALVRAMRVTSFAQIGTFDGLTVRNLLDNCPELQNITTVDLPDSMHANKGAGTVYPSDALMRVCLATPASGRAIADIRARASCGMCGRTQRCWCRRILSRHRRFF